MRLGIMGGTFDPPHYAHLILAEFAREQLALDRVWWVVAADPPHKKDRQLSPVNHRIEMVKRAVRMNPAFDLSLVDIQRPGPHYTVETLAILHQRIPDAQLILLIGSDSLRDFPTWHNPAGLIGQARLGVMNRPGVTYRIDDLEVSLPGISAKIDTVDAPLVDISSREIRNRVSEGRTIRYLLPSNVEDYIHDRY